MQFNEVLRTFAEFFEREGIRYALAGGNAVLAWGHDRLTHDADFVVEGRHSRHVIAYAESLGYRTTFVSAAFSNHHHTDDTLGHVDLLYVYGETAEAMFAAAEIRQTVGISPPVLRPEHIIAMKVHAMKNRPCACSSTLPTSRTC